MDQLEKLYNYSYYMIPFAMFMVGLLGSLHCAGMCGAFVVTCSKNKKHNALYQVGRLSAYLCLALLFMSLGSIIDLNFVNKEVVLVASVFMGISFIYLGLRGILSFKLKPPAFLNTFIQSIWRRVLKKNTDFYRTSFLIGFVSIFLPCGLLYSMMIPLVALKSLPITVFGVIGFWIGTLPVMALAPSLINRILTPIRLKAPIFLSMFLILFGLSTIGFRLYHMDYNVNTVNPSLYICH